MFSSIKALYLLNSFAACVAFVGLGVMALERARALRGLLLAGFGALFALVTAHILHIGLARGFALAL